MGELARSNDSVIRLAVIDRDEGATRVALKFPNVRTRETLDGLFRARDVGRRLAQLQHRHIVSATEVCVVEGHICLAQHVDGLDLLEWLEILSEAQVRMPTSVVVEVIRAVASALDAAQNRPILGESTPLGLTKRDLKPANILVDQSGDVKLIDFRAGLTSLQGRHAKTRLLHSGYIRYLSPSRRAGRRSSPQDDIYALGLIAIELFRGRWLRRLRTDNPAHDRYFAQLVATLENVQFKEEAADNVLRTLLLRMVAFDPEARPSAEQIQHICRRLAQDAVGASIAKFMNERGTPIIAPLPPMATLRIPLRVYPEQPLDLPEYEVPLFGQVKFDDPNQVEWQETVAGWIEIAITSNNYFRKREEEADATENALRSLQPGTPTSKLKADNDDEHVGYFSGLSDPTVTLRLAVAIAALGLTSLLVGLVLIYWSVSSP